MKQTKKTKVKSVKILEMSTFYIGWCCNIAQKNIIKNKEKFLDEETWWKLWEDDISGKENIIMKNLDSESKIREKMFFQIKGVNLSMIYECYQYFIIFQTRNMSSNTYRIMGGWKTLRVLCVGLTYVTT